VCGGRGRALAIKADGSLWAWGNNEYGQLGKGTFGDWQPAPVQAGAATGWAVVDAGGAHSEALMDDRRLWAWGINWSGQLGLGGVIDRSQSSPVLVGTANDHWAAVSAGDDHTVALKADGSVWAWGANSRGQLGGGPPTGRNAPAQVGADTDWVVVSAHNHTLALKADGSVWAWGYNEYGQVGDDTTTDRNVPTKVGDGYPVPAK
jgi:YD repeat-containing protein